MDRRDFVKGAGVAGLFAATGTGWMERAMAAEPRGAMGRPLGPNETLLVHNAKLVDVAGGKLFDETAILIRGNKIDKRVSPTDVPGTGADRKIDAGGRWLIPGLINAHCHMTMPGVAALSLALIRNFGDQIDRNCVDCATHGVTTVRDQLGRQDSIMNRQQRIARGDLMGPRIMRGIAVDVPDGYFDYPQFLLKGGSIISGDVSGVRDAVARAVDSGADHIKLPLQYKSLMQDESPIQLMTDKMLAAAVDKAAALGKTCAVHHTSLEGFRRALKAGIQSFEHMSRDFALTDEDVQNFKDAGRAVVPTGNVAYALCFPLAGDENFEHPFVKMMWEDKNQRIDSLLDEYTVPAISAVGKSVYKKYSEPGYFDVKHRMITPSARFFNAAGAVGGDNMMKMYNAGCKLGCGNDGGVPFIWPGSLSLEMYLGQLSGMKPADILRSATATNAEIIGMEDELGTLDPGKIADAVLLDHDPLEDMEQIGKTVAVLQSGRLVHTTGAVREDAH